MRTHQEIIDAAQAGEAGRLVFAFLSEDRNQRVSQINDTIRRLPLDGLAVRVLLNPDDARGQPIPVEAEGKFRTWSVNAAVPLGEFHLVISKVQ